MRLGNFGYLLALELGSDHRAHILLILVPISLWLERSRKTFNELSRQLLFLFFHFDLVSRNGLRRANLIGIEHHVQQHARSPLPDNHDVLPSLQGELRDYS